MPRIRKPPAEIRYEYGYWCPRHGWWIDEAAEWPEAKPVCECGPCGGEMEGPYEVEIKLIGSKEAT
jgi:hypothetical protein